MKNHSSHINLPKFTSANSKNIVIPNLNYILLKIFFFQSKFQPHINLSQIYTSHPNSITFSFKHSSPPQTRPKFHEFSQDVICTLEPILSLQRRVPNRDWNPWRNRSRSSRRWHFTKLDIFRWSQRVYIPIYEYTTDNVSNDRWSLEHHRYEEERKREDPLSLRLDLSWRRGTK